MYKSVVVLLGFLALASAMPAADTDVQVSDCSITAITEDIVSLVVKTLNVGVDVVVDGTSVVTEISTCAKGQKWLAVVECIITSFSGESQAVKAIVGDIKEYVTYVKTAVPKISQEIKDCKKKSLLDFIGEEEF